MIPPMGFYIPLALMYEKGIDPFSYYKAVIFPETFESILKSVAYGKLDSGFIISNILENEDNSVYSDNIRIIIKSDPLPLPLIVIRNDFNKELSIIFQQAIIDISNNLNISNFEVPNSNEFNILTHYLNILEKNNASPE